MPVFSGRVRVSSAGYGDVLDLTDAVTRVVGQSGVDEGTVAVFVPGSTAAITLMEFERGAVRDLKEALDRLVPAEGDYEHNRLNHDTNSHAHIRAAIVGASETIPLSGGKLQTGTWQQVVLVDFDTRPRERTVLVQVIS